MNTYRIKLKAQSGFLTPFQADTIFGHLCWVIAHQDGEGALQEFLAPFSEGAPPFLISDGFPGDFLPKPLSADFLSQNPDKAKEIKKIGLVSFEDFSGVINGKDFDPTNGRSDGFEKSLSVHNAINRLTNTTLAEGGVYTLAENNIEDSHVSIYVKCVDQGWHKKATDLFKILEKSGYGKKKSIGKGQFFTVADESEFIWPAVANPTGFVTLSSFCPAEDDPVEGLYKTFVKYGKLGEEFTFCGNPFKYPLLMLKAGAVFKTKGVPKEFYGRMVKNVAPAKKEAVQYAYAFALPVHFPDLDL